MRVYIGDTDAEAGGRRRVFVAYEEPRPDIREVVEILGELNKLMDLRREGRGTGKEFDRHRAETMARKEAILDQLRAAEDVPPPTQLVHRGLHSPDGFDWGSAGDQAADLAYSILITEIGEPPPPAVCLRFRDDVIAALPSRSFRLASTAVWEWIEANRSLVEHELFEKIPPPLPPTPDEPALAVTETDEPAEPAAISEASGSAVVRACEQAWSDIQHHHPELPDVVVILGSGVERGRLVKLGHWWGGRWLADGKTRGEVLLAGEALNLEPEQVFEVLLHEAAHGLNAARRIPDTSRGGRYHNGRFAATAKEVFLEAEQMPPYGFAATKLAPAAGERYAQTISRLSEAMRIARQIDRNVKLGVEGESGLEGGRGAGPGGDNESARSRKSIVTAVCGCGRRLRMAPSVWGQGAVACGSCGTAFEDVAERRVEKEAGEAVVDETFLARRRAALEEEATRRSGLPSGPAAVLDAERARLAAALALGPEENAHTRPLLQRIEHIERLLRSSDHQQGPLPPAPAASETQREGVRELLKSEAGGGDLAEVSRWYSRFGTPGETPMPPEPAGSGDRTGLARALLKADGTIRGPSLPLGDDDVATGDRVVASRDVARLGLPAGTPGVVEQIDEATRGVHIDFATWGRLEVSVAEMLEAGIAHGYVAEDVTPTPLDVGDALTVEANRIDPGAGW